MAKKKKSKLAQRIRTELDSIPVVDTHTHLGTRGIWQARNLADLVSYHWVAVELARAARGRLAMHAKTDPKGFMKEALPLLPLIRNTSNHFTLMGMLRDLYDLEERTITPNNWKKIDEKIQKRADDPAWLPQVLDRGNVAGLVVNEGMSVPTQDVEWRYYAEAEPQFGIQSAETLDALQGDGPRIESPDDLDAALNQWVDRLATKGVGTLHVALRPDLEHLGWQYGRADATRVRLALRLLWQGEYLRPVARQALNSFCSRSICSAAGRQGMVVQLFHGTVGYDHATANLPTDMSYWDPAFLRSHALLFEQCPQTRFDLFLGTRIPSHEATRLSRIYFNVSVSGAWWHAFTPTTMATMFRDRLEGLPLNAWNAFFSDGYVVEWVYGKLLLTRHVLSGVLVDMIKEGYLAEEDAVDVAHSLLYANPWEMYG